MDAVAKNTLEASVQETALAILDELVKHHVKGADLIQQGFMQALEIKEEVELWWDILKKLLTILKPMFEVIRDWLVKCYNHLVSVFDWAKEMWHKIFG